MKRAHHYRTALALTLASILVAALVGCTKIDPPIERKLYVDQTSEANVLNNLQVSYLKREIPHYSDLLADDFQFYFDEGTRLQNTNLPVSWNRETDTLQTKALFESQEVTDIKINLQFGAARPANEIGKEGWTFIDVLDTFLEVDLAPKPGELEGLTLRVDGQQQRFYFRKGRTRTDTDTTLSATAKNYYLVEWKDYGMSVKPEIASSNP